MERLCTHMAQTRNLDFIVVGRNISPIIFLHIAYIVYSNSVQTRAHDFACRAGQ